MKMNILFKMQAKLNHNCSRWGRRVTLQVSTEAHRGPSAPGICVTQERLRGGAQLVLLDQTLLVAVKQWKVMHVSLLRPSTAASLGDSLQGTGALWAEGGGGGQVLWDTGTGGEGGVGRVAFAVEVINAVGGPGI